ncbi:MAG: HAD family hydrolase [Eubacterium sp.]
MSNYKCAIFDLDGTLVNTIDDLAGACEILLKKYNFSAQWSLDDYKKFVGNGAKLLVKRAFDNTLSDDELSERYEEFKIIYNKIKLDHAYPYEGIIEQLKILKEQGIKLCVVTNKPDTAAKGMVEYIFGKGFFDVIIGAVDGVPKKPNPANVLKALDTVNCRAKDSLYFGDSDVDMITARNAGIEAIGVSWGFRSFAELFAQHPSAIIDEPKYISKLF